MKIEHPTLAAAKDVPESAVSRWTAAGWLPAIPPDGSPGSTPTPEVGQTRIGVLECPTCAQSGYMPCVTKSGRALADYHARRLAARATGAQNSDAATAADQGQHSDEGAPQ